MLRKALPEYGLLPGHVGSVTDVDPFKGRVTVRFEDIAQQEVAVVGIEQQWLVKVEPGFMKLLPFPVTKAESNQMILFWNIQNFIECGPPDFVQPVIWQRGESPVVEFTPGILTAFPKEVDSSE